MKKCKKFVFILLSVLMVGNTVSPVFSHASMQDSNDTICNESTQELDENELAYYLELYFSKIGKIDENGNYYIINASILDLESHYNPYAGKMLEEYYDRQNRSAYSFGKCVLGDQFGWAIDLIKGDTWSALGKAMAAGSWSLAGKILKNALTYVSKIAGKTVGAAFTVASLAYSAYVCRAQF